MISRICHLPLRLELFFSCHRLFHFIGHLANVINWIHICGLWEKLLLPAITLLQPKQLHLYWRVQNFQCNLKQSILYQLFCTSIFVILFPWNPVSDNLQWLYPSYFLKLGLISAYFLLSPLFVQFSHLFAFFEMRPKPYILNQ